MARLQSTQKPTTLLTLKKSKLLANQYKSTGEIILITDVGIIDGDVRMTSGPDPSNTVPGALGKGTTPLYPVGSIIYFAGDTPPDGFLLCDGSTYSVSDYPELAITLRNGTYGTGASSPYNGSNYPYTSWARTHFTVPNYKGKFIRNLNQIGITQNSSNPDYWKVDVNKFGFWDNRYQDGTSRYKVSRTYGSTQGSTYLRHRHQSVTDDTSNTYKSYTTSSGNHNHQYYGAPRSSYYVNRDGNVITGDGWRNLGDDADGFGRQLGSDEGSFANEYYVDFGIWSRDTPGRKNSAKTESSGAHIHFGYLGMGHNYSDQNNTTTLKSSHVFDINKQDNSTETRPINYSVLYCIKY